MAATSTDTLVVAKEKIEEIARNPKLKQEAIRILPEVERMLDRVSNANIYVELQPLLLTKRLPDFGAGEAGQRLHQAWLKIYYDQLRNFPLVAIRAGVNEVVRTHVYPDMPQPAEIVKAVTPIAYQIKTAHYRLKKAVDLDLPPKPTAEETARVRAMMAEEGWLDADGRVSASGIMRSIQGQGRPALEPNKPKGTPQEMAARLRGEKR